MRCGRRSRIRRSSSPAHRWSSRERASRFPSGAWCSREDTLIRTVPTGYEQLEIDGTLVVAQRDRVGPVRAALRSGTLYGYAAAHEEARPLAGRGIAYAAPLPDGAAVVVRHNRHGGLL